MKLFSTVFIVLGFVFLLLVSHYFIYDSVYVQEAANKALHSIKGKNLKQLVTKRINVQEVIQGIRTGSGNAAEHYQLTLKIYDDGNRPADETRDVSMLEQWSRPEATSEDREKLIKLAQTPDLIHIENGAVHHRCNFTGDIFSITNNLVETKLPNLLIAMRYARLMIEKAKELEDSGYAADAERELQLAVSFGNHLEGEYFLITTLVGLKIQSLALDALQKFYERQGQHARVGVCERYAKEVTRLTSEIRKLSQENTFGALALSAEGRNQLKQLFQSPDVLKSVKSEIAVQASIHYVRFFTGKIYGPPSGSEAFVDELVTMDDPLLADLVEKSKTFLRLSLRERWNFGHGAELLQ